MQYNISNNINKLFQTNYIINKINQSNIKEINDIKIEINNIKKEINDLNKNTKQLNNEYNILKNNIEEMNLKNIYLSNQINKIIEKKKIYKRLLLNIKNENSKLIILNCISNYQTITNVNTINKYIEKNIN